MKISPTMGSLFDGSGGFPLGGLLHGIEPIWASEVEPYPIAVTKLLFPNMKHLGNISKIHGGEIDPVDVVTFGSPCQDMSIAGKRAGLLHTAKGDDTTTRSGLFYEAIRIMKEMREATHGKYPSFAVWENVPGALTSAKGEDFRCVLQELLQIAEGGELSIPRPANGKWLHAGEILADHCSIAWRILDAQYWGVPQRRKRIYLVADFAGKRAGKILFEREGVRGHFAQGGTQRKGTATHPQGGSAQDDREGEGFDRYNQCITGGTSATQETNNDPYLFHPVSGVLLDDQGGQQVNVRTDDKSPTLRAEARGNVPCIVEAAGFKAGQSMAEQANTQAVIVFDKEVYNSGAKATGGHYIAEYGHAPTLRTACLPGICTRYIVRRLTPLECNRLQGFPDGWGDIPYKDDMSDEEYAFWTNVRNTHIAITGGKPRTFTKKAMLGWYNKLHTDSAEYKMWGNGVAEPCVCFVMDGIASAMVEQRAVPCDIGKE